MAALFVGGVGSTINVADAQQIIGLGWFAVFAAIIGLVGAGLVKSKTKIAGIVMIVSAILGTIAISAFYILGTILLGIAGILALVKKEK